METDAEPMEVIRYRRPVPDDTAIDRCFEMIKQAKNPVILAGNGCIRRRASTQLREFCEKTGIGVINTFMAKGAVDMDADYCLYTIGLQSKDLPACAIDAADLVISIGFDMVEYPPRLWNPDGTKPIVHIDFLHAEIDVNYHPDAEAIGDVAHAIGMLSERVDRNGGLRFDLPQQKATRRDMWEDISAHKDDDAEGVIKPQKALWDVRQVMGPGDILLSDVGAHKMWIARYYQCHEPNSCLIPNGFCSMGFALPGVIAADLVHPDRRTMAICGDAGFMMNVQEMETARRLNSNIVVMVWEDNAYGLIAWKQDTHFGHHTDLEFSNPDWLKLADAFGWNGFWCEKSGELRQTLEQAFAAEGPSLLVIPIDYRENGRLTERLGNIACPI